MKGISHATIKAHCCFAWVSPVKIPPSEPQLGYKSMAISTLSSGVNYNCYVTCNLQ